MKTTALSGFTMDQLKAARASFERTAVSLFGTTSTRACDGAFEMVLRIDAEIARRWDVAQKGI